MHMLNSKLERTTGGRMTLAERILADIGCHASTKISQGDRINCGPNTEMAVRGAMATGFDVYSAVMADRGQTVETIIEAARKQATADVEVRVIMERGVVYAMTKQKQRKHGS